MKPLRANSPLLLGLVALALFSGCENKKPVVHPPQAQVPSPAPSPAPAGQETQPAQESQPSAQGTPPPDPGQPQSAEEKPEAQPAEEKAMEKTDQSKAKAARSSKKSVPQPPSGATNTRNTPPRIVVKPDGAEPSATPGQISPSPSNTGVSHDQATTEQLLQSSEFNLNGIKRQLSQDEQAIVTQIRDYLNQSRQAIKDNDLVRAHNLALKAHLLSDELAKRR